MQNEVRALENKIDKYVETRPIMCEPRCYAIWYLLTAHEHLIIDEKETGRLGFTSPLHLLDQMKYALIYGLIWAYKSCPEASTFSTPVTINNRRMREAENVIKLGLEYQGIWTAYTCWTRGLFKAEMKDSMTVIFKMPREEIRYDAWDMKLKLSRQDKEDGSTFSNIEQVKSFGKVKHEICNAIRTHSGHRISVDFTRIDFDTLKNLLEDTNKFNYNLPSQWTYKERSIGNFREFWLTVLTISAAHTIAHDHILHSDSSISRLATFVMVKTKSEWIELIKSISKDLSKEIIEQIFSIFSYDSSISMPDPALQPFVVLADEQVALAPQLFMGCNHERNLLALLSKIDSDEYNKTTSIFEDELISKFNQRLKRKSWKLAYKKKVIGRKDLPDIDYVIFDNKKKIMLIIELKWVIPPSEAAERFYRSETEAIGIVQIKALIGYAETNKRNFFESCFPGVQVQENYDIKGCVAIKGFVGTAKNYDPMAPVIEADFLLDEFEKMHDLGVVVSFIFNREYLSQISKDIEIVSTKCEIGPYAVYCDSYTFRKAPQATW